ncbi:MAG: NgoFVII family restriction endonuclease [Selenomonadaceae bacterium]|nr:NgoFVII family restriction endonuclease [Selenomonadaceae bacterium]
MEYLYSDLDALAGRDGLRFGAQFRADIAQADRLWIAVGYASADALQVLDQLVRENHVREVHVILGMYYQQGIQRNILAAAREVNAGWIRDGLGDISVVEPYLYHGKVYLFGTAQEWSCAYVGSTNLSADIVAEPPADQFEVSSRTDDHHEVQEAADFIERLRQPGILQRLDEVTDMHILVNNYYRRIGRRRAGRHAAAQEQRQAALTADGLMGEELYTFYRQHENQQYRFEIPILVPRAEDRFNRAGGAYSNINVCYAEGRPRPWWEMQVRVPAYVARQDGFPVRGQEFAVVFDTGRILLAHGISGADVPKNLSFREIGVRRSSDQNIGHWFKQIFIDAGLVHYINTVQEDPEHLQMITQEMLDEMQIHNFVLTGTDQTREDEDGNVVPVFTMRLE